MMQNQLERHEEPSADTAEKPKDDVPMPPDDPGRGPPIEEPPKKQPPKRA